VAPLSSLPSDPAYVYHATNEDNAREIAASGWLVPHRPWYGTDQRMWPDGATENATA